MADCVPGRMLSRRTSAALVLSGLLVLAGCTGAPTGTERPRDPATNVTVELDQSGDRGTTVTVAGHGSVDAEPDAATLRLTVAAEGDTPETVRNRLSRNVSAAREALLAFGLDEEQVRSEEFRIRENYRAEREPNAGHPEYIGYHSLVVELNDTDAVGGAIDAAVESGPVRVEGVTFGLSEQRRDQLRDRALTEAVENAREEAELVAGTEGLVVVSAERMTTDRVNVDQSSGTVYHEAAATATAQADAGSTRVESDDVTVTASVTVVYNATASGDGE